MLKKIAIGVAGLIVIIAVAAYFLWSNLDSLIKAAIEKYGSQATQTEVRVSSVKLSISSGNGGLSGIEIANPKGFSSGNALYLGAISVTINPNSVTGGGPIEIREIDIEKPQVTFEITPTGDTNLQTIQRNATGASGGGHAAAESSAGGGSGTGAGAQERKIIIDDLQIREGEVAISSPLLQGKALSAPLPAIHLTNIGKSEGGATPAQIASQIIGSITAGASKVAMQDLTKQLGALGGLGKTLGGSTAGTAAPLGDQLKGLLGK
jgi:hypothetical protein